jgi:hypothetical protein
MYHTNLANATLIKINPGEKIRILEKSTQMRLMFPLLLILMCSCAQDKQKQMEEMKKGFFEGCANASDPSVKALVDLGVDMNSYCDCSWNKLISDAQRVDRMLNMSDNEADQWLQNELAKDTLLQRQLSDCLLEQLP